MEALQLLSMFVLGVAVATPFVAGIVIYSRKRRKARSAAEEARREAEKEDQRRTAEQEALRRAEEAQRKAQEEAQRKAEEEAQRRAEKETQRKAQEEAQRKVEEEARRKAEEEARQRAEEARRKAEEEAQRKAQEEAQWKAKEEARRKAEEEIRRQAEEEAQRKAEEEAQRKVEEEARQQAEEKKQQKAEEEAHRQAEEEERRKADGGKQVDPGKRGGQPRVSTQEPKKQPARPPKPRSPKPEVVCWKRERQWILAVEVPEGLRANSSLKVLQNESSLTEDETQEGCWRLEQICGQVVVCWNESGETKIEIGEDDYLLFKLSGDVGRHVRSPSSGSYLVVVPDDWKRDETLSGLPPVTPEPVSLTGYQAHFFSLENDGDRKIAFRTPEGKPVEIKSKSAQFDLVGNELKDASERMGPLFGKGPPRIRALDNRAWEDVGSIVIGEEGSGQGKWRTDFTPDAAKIEQDVPSELADRKGGWYFVRIYDKNDDLVESMDFRFLCDLKEINIPSSSLFPSDSGHELVSVEFIHEPDCVVKPADGLASSIQTKPEDGKTILTIPPKAAYDASRWRVGPPNGTRIDVTVLVERVWWAISGESNEPSEWGDKVFTLSREDFFPTSDKTLWLRFPKRRWTDRVLVGFDRSKARDYPVKVAEETVAIPLRNFESSQEVGDRTQQHRFKVWIERREGVIAVIPALHYWVGVGRSKAAKAEAVLREGHRGISVKGEPIEGYFQRTQPEDKRYLLRLLRLKGLQTAFSQLEGDVTVERGTPCGRRQAKAVAHALVQALAKRNPELKPLLQHKGFWRNSKKRG